MLGVWRRRVAWQGVLSASALGEIAQSTAPVAPRMDCNHPQPLTRDSLFLCRPSSVSAISVLSLYVSLARQMRNSMHYSTPTAEDKEREAPLLYNGADPSSPFSYVTNGYLASNPLSVAACTSGCASTRIHITSHKACTKCLNPAADLPDPRHPHSMRRQEKRTGT